MDFGPLAAGFVPYKEQVEAPAKRQKLSNPAVGEVLRLGVSKDAANTPEQKCQKKLGLCVESGRCLENFTPLSFHKSTPNTKCSSKKPATSGAVAAACLADNKGDKYAFYRSLGSPKWILAPMVSQSELPFRILCRANGVHLAYTPMILAHKFVHNLYYRQDILDTCRTGDRPLIIQFAGNDCCSLVRACLMVQHLCDGIDINLGCAVLLFVCFLHN